MTRRELKAALLILLIPILAVAIGLIIGANYDYEYKK